MSNKAKAVVAAVITWVVLFYAMGFVADAIGSSIAGSDNLVAIFFRALIPLIFVLGVPSVAAYFVYKKIKT